MDGKYQKRNNKKIIAILKQKLNHFVAGSSVFPTEGYANPTLTIVALAIKLADKVTASL